MIHDALYVCGSLSQIWSENKNQAVVSDLISQTSLPLHYIGVPHPNEYVYWYKWSKKYQCICLFHTFPIIRCKEIHTS